MSTLVQHGTLRLAVALVLLGGTTPLATAQSESLEFDRTSVSFFGSGFVVTSIMVNGQTAVINHYIDGPYLRYWLGTSPSEVQNLSNQFPLPSDCIGSNQIATTRHDAHDREGLLSSTTASNSTIYSCNSSPE